MNSSPLNGSATPSGFHIATHAQAMDFARCLAADFEHAQVAALSDSQGAIFDGATLTEDIHQIQHAVGFAICVALTLGTSVKTITLFSVVDHEVGTLTADQQMSYLRVIALFEGWLELRDWIITDGVHYRSAAYSLDPSGAWPNDPIRARTAVLDSRDPGYW